MQKKRALVLSIDAMTGSDLAVARQYPHFSALLSDCALAAEVESVFPSLTYPCHVAMATGCHPKHTGVVNNEIFLPDTLNRPWYFYAGQIGRPTIFDAARKAGISTGCVMWPCMGKGPIDTLVPEIWGKTPDDPFLEPFCGAGTADFIREIWPRVGGIAQGFRQPMFDRFVVAIAREVILRRRPELLYVHICQIDNAKHYSGLHSPQVHSAIENTDQLIGSLLDALDEAGLREETNIVLCSDHGQQPVTHISYPNRLLAGSGLVRGDVDGNIAGWRAQVQSACLSALLYAGSAVDARGALDILGDPENMQALGIAEIILHDEAIERYHLDGGFAAVLLGRPGIYFSNAMDAGPFCLPVEESGMRYRANHGHDPRHGEKPFFLISGPDAAKNARIQSMRLIDEPVTVAALMGLEMPWADGVVQRSLLA